MSPLTFRFTGPDHQVVAAVDGRVVVSVWDAATLVALQDAAMDPVRVTVTGPFTGGEGLENPTSPTTRPWRCSRGGPSPVRSRTSRRSAVGPRGRLRAASGVNGGVGSVSYGGPARATVARRRRTLWHRRRSAT